MNVTGARLEGARIGGGWRVLAISLIDLILIRDGMRARDAQVIGIDPALRTPDGLWPSDHAGVVAPVMLTAR
ncbi:MAG: hypothetical protein EA340_04540 [Nitriliruptor sp.]|nr:MAG: hypothetical protein EA340_04540 [Nitriliruptor sp.]